MKDSTSLSIPHAEPPVPGTVTEVAEGLFWFRLPLPMALDHVNLYAADEGDHWSLIDTGLDWKKGRAVLEAVLAGPLGAKPVGRVIVTHHHPDHVGLAAMLAARGAEIWMPRTGWLLTRMLCLDEQALPDPKVLAWYRRAGMDAVELARRQGERPFNFADCVGTLPLGYIRLYEGQRVHLAGRDWQVRMGGGHAPEHATLWAEGEALIIAGDQLLPGISPNISVSATEPQADPLADWLEACNRFAPLADDRQLVLPGHKLPYRGLPHRLAQLADNHHGALARLLAHLAEPRRGGACFAPLFARTIGPAEYSLAFGEANAHLNHLLAQGLVTRRLGADGVWLWQRA